MVGGIYGGYSGSSLFGTQNYLSQKPSSVSNYDYKAAQKQTQSLIDQYKQENGKVQLLKEDSAKFLDEYIASMEKLGKAADTVKGGNFDKLLYGSGGTESKPTQENIDKTAEAVTKLVEQFNSSLKLAGDNTKRGSGVSRQVNRMVQSPTSARSMELIGITTQKDGSLKVDGDKLKAALKEKPGIARDVVGGNFGMAQGISRDSAGGLGQSPASLIGNDLVAMKQQQQQTLGTFESMSAYGKSGAYNMMNLNSVGVLMNMLV